MCVAPKSTHFDPRILRFKKYIKLFDKALSDNTPHLPETKNI